LLDTKYLRYWLDALSRAHTMHYFADGHRGAAIIAAYFFCQDFEVEDGVSDILSALIDEQWVSTPLCKPLPKERYDTSGIEQILDVLQKNLGALRQVGHNVIFPAMALKAFARLPEMITPARVDGICKLIQAFTVGESLVLNPADVRVGFSRQVETANFILSESLRTMCAFSGRGQGWSGHLLTYSKALMDLRELGYVETAEQAEYAFNLYVKRIRMGPLDTDIPRKEHQDNHLYPLQLAYWENRKGLPLRLGHSIKYPYGFYGWLALTRDQALENQCLQQAFHIF
jgi:hypothetical protein